MKEPISFTGVTLYMYSKTSKASGKNNLLPSPCYEKKPGIIKGSYYNLNRGCKGLFQIRSLLQKTPSTERNLSLLA